MRNEIRVAFLGRVFKRRSLGEGLSGKGLCCSHRKENGSSLLLDVRPRVRVGGLACPGGGCSPGKPE